MECSGRLLPGCNVELSVELLKNTNAWASPPEVLTLLFFKNFFRVPDDSNTQPGLRTADVINHVSGPLRMPFPPPGRL